MVILRVTPLVFLVILEVFMLQVLAADNMLIPYKANCSSTQFQCTNGGCIPENDHCNCWTQCSDGSDEKDCNDVLSVDSWHRIHYPYYCPSGECIPHMYVCSDHWSLFRRSDCADMSVKNCSDVAPCGPLQFECANGKCIQTHKQCDGFTYSDCGDWSDEDNCFDKCVGDFVCPNGRCMHDSEKCDCEDDCGDGSDENDCHGRSFQCRNGNCLPEATDGERSKVCNCEDDCGDGSDEENCDGRTFQCSNGTCLLGSKICDSVEDCSDGADEKKENCKEFWRDLNEDDFRFVCHQTGKHLKKTKLNDGFDDCGDGSDENYCSDKPFHCAEGECFLNPSLCENKYGCANRSAEGNCTGKCEEFQCPGGGPCIHNNKVCDCGDDCGDGADEKNCKGHYQKKLRGYDISVAHVFHCKDSKCLTLSICDGLPDCEDNTDEMECFGICSDFECPSGRCIPYWFQCDGINDCGDWTDEKNCSKKFTNTKYGCTKDEFQCNSGQCISKSRVCQFNDDDDGRPPFLNDLHTNCRDGSDYENCDWRADFKCGKHNNSPGRYNKPAQCNPFGKYPCCSDQGWCGNTADHCDCPDCIDYRVCTNGTIYQTNNARSICTCVNGKYQCKDKGCVTYSAKLLDDGCNYCVCNKEGKYEWCTERNCNTFLNSEMSTEGSNHPDNKNPTSIPSF